MQNPFQLLLGIIRYGKPARWLFLHCSLHSQRCTHLYLCMFSFCHLFTYSPIAPPTFLPSSTLIQPGWFSPSFLSSSVHIIPLTSPPLPPREPCKLLIQQLPTIKICNDIFKGKEAYVVFNSYLMAVRLNSPLS